MRKEFVIFRECLIFLIVVLIYSERFVGGNFTLVKNLILI